MTHNDAVIYSFNKYMHIRQYTQLDVFSVKELLFNYQWMFCTNSEYSLVYMCQTFHAEGTQSMENLIRKPQ